MSAQSPKPDPVPLSGAHMPADHGLTSLGLLMQLGGAVFGGLLACSALILLLTEAPAFLIWKAVLIMGLSAVRSAYHYRAGRALVHGPPMNSVDGPLSAVARYIYVALIHTALCGFILYGDAGSQVLTMVAVWAAWPLAMFVLLRSPHLAVMGDRIPRAEDLALEGASVYMLLFGIIGALISGLLIYRMFDAVEIVFSFEVLATYVILGLLLCRSLLHVRAGRVGITGDLTAAGEQTGKYTRFSAGSTIIIIILMVLSMGREAIAASTIALLGMIGFLLWCWPSIINRFMNQRLVDGYATPGGIHERRAPDMGLTALGWLLLALSLYGLAATLPTLLVGTDSGQSLSEQVFTAPTLGALFGRSAWLSIVVHGLQLWAAIELIRMLDGYKIPATLYALVGTALTVYVIWPFFNDIAFARFLLDNLSLGHGVVIVSQIGISLAVPLSVLYMVRREPPALARARFRRPE